MARLGQNPNHPADCSGCPDCDALSLAALALSPRQLGTMLAARDAGMFPGKEGAGRVLRTASAGTLRTGGAACGCGGGEKKRNEKLLAEARALTGRREEELRALTSDALVQLVADAVVERRALTHPVCTYGLSTPRAAASIDWSGRGEPGARTALLTDDEQKVYTSPSDSYDLAGLARAREAAANPHVHRAAGELPANWTPTTPPDAYDIAGLEQHRQAALRGEAAA